MMTRHRHSNKLRALTLAAVLGAGACADSTSASRTAPTLPPAASMQADLDFFEQNASASDRGTAGLAGSSFISAAVTVGIAKVATYLVLAIPAATFSAAVSDDPVFTDGKFHWEYSATGQGYAYQVDLSAEPSGNQSFWEMRVTSATHSPPLNHFLWVSGQSSLEADEGEWHLFDANTPATQTEILRVSWQYESETDRSLTLTNVRAGTPDAGDQLEFVVDGNVRTMRFTDASEDTEVFVQWNAATNEGFIEAPSVNGGARACWNANLENVACAG